MEEEVKEVKKDPGSEIDAFLNDDVTPAPVTDPLKEETPKPIAQPAAEVTEPTEDKAQGKPAAEPAKDSSEQTKTETPEPKLYAGKYTTQFDLIEGVLEEVKALKGDKKEVAALVDEASKSGDWTKVEAKYKELQAKVVKQVQEAKKAEATKPTTETPAKDPAETDLTDEEFSKLITDTTMRQISTSELAKKFDKYGVKIPTTQEALDDLEIAYPALYTQFTDAFKELWRSNEKQARAYMQSEREAPGHNAAQKEQAKQKIAEFATEWKLELDDAAINAAIEDAITKGGGFVYETRNGVQFLRPESIFKYFMAERGPELLAEVRKRTEVAALNKGREEGFVDAAKKAADVPKTISTSSTPSSTAKPKAIDWNNPDEAKAAGRGAIQSRIEEVLSTL